MNINEDMTSCGLTLIGAVVLISEWVHWNEEYPFISIANKTLTSSDWYLFTWAVVGQPYVMFNKLILLHLASRTDDDDDSCRPNAYRLSIGHCHMLCFALTFVCTSSSISCQQRQWNDGTPPRLLNDECRDLRSLIGHLGELLDMLKACYLLSVLFRCGSLLNPIKGSSNFLYVTGVWAIINSFSGLCQGRVEAWWLSGRFGALRPEGCWFEFHSSRHIETLGTSLEVAFSTSAC